MKSFIAFLFSILVIIGSSIGCKSVAPWNVMDVNWCSENPKIEISRTGDSEWTGYLFSGEQKINVNLFWGRTGNFEICYAGNEISSDTILLQGRFTYNNESVILQVKLDKIYDYQYEKIILYKQTIEINS